MMWKRHLMVAVALSLAATSAWAETIQVTIDKLAFSPANVEAKVGDTIVWVNRDAFAHTATVQGDWDILLPPGKSGRLTLKKAGAVDYFCRFHPNMKGHLTVKP